ncbi:MAG: hypothetical protein QOI12_4616 [Alphaproteobacteria bacterium]|jgi:hypothetical protein|nr:hypothetical protein [Alphaproteobacteria bacterium]
MATAREIADFLAYELLKHGNYTASVGPVNVPDLAVAAAAAAEDEDVVLEYAQRAEPFGGLAVQSVGFEDGVGDAKVHIYLTRGSSRLIKSLPDNIDGVPVRVHNMGPITVRPEAASAATNRGHLFERKNRVCCGSSCAPTSENCTGTFGAIVRKGSAHQLYLLSNNHVFGGCNHVPQNQPILAPSSNDGNPTVRAPGEIGRHHEIHELRSGNPVFVNPCDADLAIARATTPHSISSWQGDGADGYDTPPHSVSPVSLMTVKKFGRTTGLTSGEIEAKVTSPMPVSYTSKYFKGTVWFKDVWTVKASGGSPFALPGDSGSLVVTADASGAVGLVFAASRNGDYAWIIPIDCVTGSFGGLKLVSGHGV